MYCNRIPSFRNLLVSLQFDGNKKGRGGDDQRKVTQEKKGQKKKEKKTCQAED